MGELIEDVIDDFMPAILVIAAILLFCCGCVLPANNYAVRIDCEQFHDQTGMSTKVGGGFFTKTCYVQTSSGRWVEKDAYGGITE